MQNKTLEFFYQIAKIPRESGNEKQISDYICNFAQNRNLEYVQDQYGNVIIKKKNIESEPIILQAHLDMVCEKSPNKIFDFEKDGIEIYQENGFLKANNTTLGADNGIGVAQMLNILDSDIKCNLECIFTVSEETTMIGAENIDVSNLHGKKMINLDGFNEHTIIIESASFFDIVYHLEDYNWEETENTDTYKIKLNGLLGGHSGFDIDKNRGNSSVLLAKLLKNIEDIKLIDFCGGTKFNVIPATAECTFSTNLEENKIKNKIDKFLYDEKKNFINLNIEIEKAKKIKETLNINDSIKFINTIINFKHGVINKNSRNEITTSVNLGVVDLKNKIMKIGMRSSNKQEERECLEKIKKYAELTNCKFEKLSSQNGFSTNENSALIKDLEKAHKEIFKNKKLNIESVHITVEAGFFKEKIENLEIAIISPEIIDAHTPNECVSLQSIKECDEWLQNFIEQKNIS